MNLSEIKLPYFPKYELMILEKNKLNIVWFDANFSQSEYNYQNKPNPSNACTLIAVLMASYCGDEKIFINPPDKKLNERLIHMLACSILEGNRIHDNLKMIGSLDNYNLTVPEAIQYAESPLIEWKSLIYMEPLLQSLYGNLKTHWLEWKRNEASETKSDLFVILITEGRSVLFIFQSNTVTLIDTHQHSDDKGAFMAIALLEKLNVLCLWFSHMIHQCYKSDTNLYELSFLYYEKQ